MNLYYKTRLLVRNQHSSVAIATRYAMDGTGSIPSIASFFFFFLIFSTAFKTGSGAHPASYQMGTWGSFPGGKAARA
jgi:hypothetical protein